MRFAVSKLSRVSQLRKNRFAIGSVCAAWLGFLGMSVSAKAADTNVQVLMRNKLEAAHGLLDALALEDYGKLEHFSSMLHDLSRASAWSKPDSGEFQYYAKSFQHAADYLMEQAKAHNLEGVTMGYVRVTLECVQCHKLVRGQKLHR